MTEAAHIDFETRSRVNIAKAGAERYARDASTSMLCLAFAFGDEPHIDAITYKDAPPTRLIEHVKAGRPVWAHNAAFEIAIWNEVLHARMPEYWPHLDASQVYDTMACALMMALPASLGELASVLRVQEQKDDAGRSLMMKLAKPAKSGEFVDPDADMARLVEYCKQDVRAERSIHKHLVMLPPQERALWVLDHKINNRGIPLDIETIKRLSAMAEAERRRVHDDVAVTTLGAAGSANEVAKLIAYLAENGVHTDTLKKADLDALLAGDIASADARRVIELRREASKVSAKKLDAMLARACDDGTAKGTLQFMGAGNTGRWAGRGIQVQNLKRTPKGFDVNDVIEWSKRDDGDDGADMVRGWYGSVIDAVSLSVRGMIKARDGFKLIANDYSNIEGRVLAWVASEQWKLDAFIAFDTPMLDEFGQRIPCKKNVFKRLGHDLYNVAYGASFGKDPADVTDDERQIGKVQELALGYQGGKGAFASMAINYGIRVVPDDDETRHAKNTLTESQVEAIKRGWRKAHPHIEKFWHMTEEAAIDAVRHKGSVFRVGPLAYRVSGNYLMCRLPSGRCLFYAGPSLIEVPAIGIIRETEALEAEIAAFVTAHNTADGRAPEVRDIAAPKAPDISRATLYHAQKALDEYAEDIAMTEGLERFIDRALILAGSLQENKRDALQTWGTDSKTRKWGKRRPYGGMLCVAGDAEVMTDRGWKRLDTVTTVDKIYDGVEFVRHDGLQSRGYKSTITLDGVRMTPDHKVRTENGWQDASSCAGFNRAKIRIPNGAELRRFGRQKITLDRKLRVRHSQSFNRFGALSGPGKVLRLQNFGYAFGRAIVARYVKAPGVCCVAFDAGSVPLADAPSMEKLRRPRYQSLRGMEYVRSVLAGYGRFVSKRLDVRSHRRERELQAIELPMGDLQDARPEQTAPHLRKRHYSFRVRGASRVEREHAALSLVARCERFGPIEAGRRSEQVYDLINCGPRNCFVLRGASGPVVAHNCENAVQAIARDILAAALINLEAAGYQTIMHVHDECVAMVPETFGSQEDMARIMTVLPEWAHGLPLAASGWQGKRYRK